MKNAAHFMAAKRVGLETIALDLEREIHKLDRRGSHLAEPDYRRMVELKKQRLRAKDRLAELRRSPRH
jgi:hypothetical protein